MLDGFVVLLPGLNVASCRSLSSIVLQILKRSLLSFDNCSFCNTLAWSVDTLAKEVPLRITSFSRRSLPAHYLCLPSFPTLGSWCNEIYMHTHRPGFLYHFIGILQTGQSCCFLGLGSISSAMTRPPACCQMAEQMLATVTDGSATSPRASSVEPSWRCGRKVRS
jgi:hypothetical protein